MRKKYLLTTVLIATISGIFAVGIYAGTSVQNVITLKTDAYAKHTKKIIKFDHLKHQQDYHRKYPEFYEYSCGECHHDQNNKPRKNLKSGMEVKKCIECHKIPEYIKGKKAKKLSKKERRQYHANALHENCKECHKKINKKTKKKTAPTTCKKCHRA